MPPWPAGMRKASWPASIRWGGECVHFAQVREIGEGIRSPAGESIWVGGAEPGRFLTHYGGHLRRPGPIGPA